ncbi:LysR family transcriptional regulator [Streptomyces sp. WMMC500]|uniref:LysR family transcriptional regulator n=1 Tax=Streptomyces sp. WMMC500 TaxID=3015154 RepID=UPI00248B4EFA|nr:LysR family transcriptional regulator [Streptomyces sp. WMMC500]WBB61063.1 LysR family transcriptional regulator [Streptomyces sp. WMMC500]
MELRDIEIFLALAEELHFGRTAERLHVSQARVSQSIAKQERRIGAPLFERTSRRVELTAIGARLHDDLRAGYRRIQEGIDAAAAAARGTTGVLTLGLMCAQAFDQASILARFKHRYPGVELRFREVVFSDPFGMLRAGEVDLEVTWLPVREPDLTVGPVLAREAHVLMVAEGHPFAGRASVSLEELADCVFPQPVNPVPAYWMQALMPARTPSGRPIPADGPKIATFQEAQAVVAAGDAVCVVQGEAARHFPRPGIAYVPITEQPMGVWGLIWRTAHETPLVRAFVQSAVDTLAAAAEAAPGADAPPAPEPARAVPEPAVARG